MSLKKNRKNKIVYFVLMTLFSLLYIAVSVVAAHPPKDIDIVWHPNDSTLSVKVEHKVDNPHKHFIDEITVFVNGKRVVTRNYASQKEDSFEEDSFYLPNIKAGDRLTVEAKCVIFGTVSKSILVH